MAGWLNRQGDEDVASVALTSHLQHRCAGRVATTATLGRVQYPAKSGCLRGASTGPRLASSRAVSDGIQGGHYNGDFAELPLTYGMAPIKSVGRAASWEPPLGRLPRSVLFSNLWQDTI